MVKSDAPPVFSKPVHHKTQTVDGKARADCPSIEGRRMKDE